ncbi:gluconate 2-dehydrogenase subunit 3 family protein [Longimicrobium sp.]|uniref:gluconate 2-dehydrogenase subunit 3 family protein n=1 Tax=Longimicrobium sp. TaxID=2029185 RepID=UPI003B3BDE3F
MTPGERQTLAAAMDRVLPPEPGPGASDANAIGYVDWLIGTEGRSGAALGPGLALLDSIAEGTCGRPFAACSPAERDQVLARMQDVPHPTAQRFFRSLVMMTVTGFLCAPRHGGNRGRAGWNAIGFVPHPLTDAEAP